jgi:hypothetical protein
MIAAFLNALIEWTAQHLRDPQARVVIPTGVVKAEELGRVLRSLKTVTVSHRKGTTPRL